jgi:hypothetical protein
MTVLFIIAGVFLLGLFFVWALGRAAAVGDAQARRALAERRARENSRPHGSVDRLR